MDFTRKINFSQLAGKWYDLSQTNRTGSDAPVNLYYLNPVFYASNMPWDGAPTSEENQTATSTSSISFNIHDDGDHAKSINDDSEKVLKQSPNKTHNIILKKTHKRKLLNMQ